MLAELEIVPLGTGSASVSPALAQVAKLIDASGLDYRVGPMGTVVEGSWDDVMKLAKQCHEAMLKNAQRVMTTIRVDDRRDQPGSGRITSKVASLEAKVGKSLKK
ncbi:MAG: MTH1187 family thiamine-binding protein [Candidatus Omnitrophica bacterium]|nr:MTH1187 family thiamine-binding protein [Candidatus Omnitrophota bacterium]